MRRAEMVSELISEMSAMKGGTTRLRKMRDRFLAERDSLLSAIGDVEAACDLIEKVVTDGKSEIND